MVRDVLSFFYGDHPSHDDIDAGAIPLPLEIKRPARRLWHMLSLGNPYLPQASGVGSRWPCLCCSLSCTSGSPLSNFGRCSSAKNIEHNLTQTTSHLLLATRIRLRTFVTIRFLSGQFSFCYSYSPTLSPPTNSCCNEIPTWIMLTKYGDLGR
jgi:hypothetical protein